MARRDNGSINNKVGRPVQPLELLDQTEASVIQPLEPSRGDAGIEMAIERPQKATN
jgi:hypothetical protein